MKKLTILLILAAFILGILVSLTITKLTPTGQVIEEPQNDYTYTRAICNENNECIDVLVECQNSKVSSLKPVSELKDFSTIEIQQLDTNEFCN